jgi:amino-acid N-acetyltransferase
MTDHDVTIRIATVPDVPDMVALVNEYAERALMLHRSLAETYGHLRDFHVAELSGPDAPGGRRLVGVAGLRIMWANLAEVYAIAVADEARGHGVGRRLVGALVEQARALAIRRLFALTYERRFFERCGFEVVDRRMLPLKVWGECVRCPKHEACDEIAMTCLLEDVPDHGTPLPSAGQADEIHYDVPIPRLTPLTARIDQSAGGTS